MTGRERLETRVVKRIDQEAFGDDRRHLQSQAKCPGCGVFGDVDEDQLRGSVSLICPECGWHGHIAEPPAACDHRWILGMCGWCGAEEHPTKQEPPADIPPDITRGKPVGKPTDDGGEHPEPREGIVTVRHWDGSYLGCMGIETWQAMLNQGPVVNVWPPADGGDRDA